jgi:hypothetical protein
MVHETNLPKNTPLCSKHSYSPRQTVVLAMASMSRMAANSKEKRSQSVFHNRYCAGANTLMANCKKN